MVAEGVAVLLGLQVTHGPESIVRDRGTRQLAVAQHVAEKPPGPLATQQRRDVDLANEVLLCAVSSFRTLSSATFS